MSQEKTAHSTSATEKAEQMIRGASAIAEYVFGDKCYRRRVYHLAERSKFPVVRIGSTLCLRPSVYAQWLKAQEEISTANQKKKD